MAKITRANQKVFGDSASASGNFGIFGSLAAASPAYSKDPATIQSLSAWLLGLSAATVGTKSPALEDMNSLFYLAFRQMAYLLQAGLAEWDADTIYYMSSFCQDGGIVYKSKIDDNVGNPVSDTNSWEKRVLERTYLCPQPVVLLDTGAATGDVWTAFDLTSQISDAGLTGKTIKAAIVQLKCRLGPAEFGVFTAGAYISAAGVNSATQGLDCDVLMTANDDSDSCVNQNSGPVPLSSSNLYYRSNVFTTATGFNTQIKLLGFIFEEPL
jgi:hypothetical protein